MTKVKFIVSALLISSSINAQISLEHTYSGNSNNSSIGFVNLSTSGDKYVINDVSLNQIKLYNSNHSLWKTITIPTIPNTIGYYYQNISENLFNTDNQVECLIIYQGATILDYQVAVINENGTIAFSKQSAAFSGILKTANNNFKLLLNDMASYDKLVYSLPGTSSNLGLPNGEAVGQVGVSYPNPTNQFITLPYDLNETNSTAEMNIYNINGQIIESFNIDNSFNSILLDLSNYTAGTYRYNITVNGIESSSNSFIKQ
jgi:hypothetical protein